MNLSQKEIIINIHRQAFGEEGNEIAALAASFLELENTISISAERGGKVVGNVLFTPYEFQDHPEKLCYLLAPIGVLPEYQGSGQGVGKELMETGIEYLGEIAVDAIFVLGIPSYYPLYGFVPTDLQTPYPELLTLPESWMVLELKPGVVGQLSGETKAVKPFMTPEHWDTSGRG